MADPHTTAPSVGTDDLYQDALKTALVAGAAEHDALAADLAAARADLQLAEEAGEKWMLKTKAALAQVETLREALRCYAALAPDEIPYHDTINDPPDIGRLARAALASSEVPATGRRAYDPVWPEAVIARQQDLGGDPGEVHPSDSRAESQAGLNGPSGSPTSPPKRDPSSEVPATVPREPT